MFIELTDQDGVRNTVMIHAIVSFKNAEINDQNVRTRLELSNQTSLYVWQDYVQIQELIRQKM